MMTVPATGATIAMVLPGVFRLGKSNRKARELMHDHGYRFDRKTGLWS
jgi:hypothetical protein